MSSRKIRLEKKHMSFNFPVTIIDSQETKQRILDAIDENKANAGSEPVDRPSQSAESSDTFSSESSTGNSNTRTFKGIAYSGKPIAKHFIFENLFLDVDGMSFKEQVPIFRNHDPSQVVGFGTLSRVGGELLIEGTIATELETAKEISALADAGFNWELSVGVEPEFIEEISQDKRFSINGQETSGPAVIFRKPKVLETSFVPIGADRNTSAQVFSKDVNNIKEIEVKNMDITTIKVDGKDVEVTLTDAGYTFSLEKEDIDLDAEYTFCPCMDAKKEDEEKLKDAKLSDEEISKDARISELEEELKAYKTKEKRAKFNKAIETSGLDLGDEEFETLNLLPEDKFEAFLSKVENTKVTSTNVKAQTPAKELFSQDKAKETLGVEATPEEYRARAKKLQEEYKEKGVELTFVSAMGMVNL